MKSAMRKNFAVIPGPRVPRSAFDRSFAHKTTFNAGDLVPIFVDEALPGDTLSVRANMFARLATPAVPFMDNLVAQTFFFSIPRRLTWDNFKKFMGEQADPDSSTDFLEPRVQAHASQGFQNGTIFDYFGLPTAVNSIYANAWASRSYNLVYNEWFRDQNLQDSVVVDKDNGPDDPADYPLQKINKLHDYFTSALPWPQKGPASTLPLGTEAPIRGMDTTTSTFTPNDQIYIDWAGTVPNYGFMGVNTSGDIISQASGTPGETVPLKWQQETDTPSANTGYNYADLSEATAASINLLRQAIQMQVLYERDARSGTRYIEVILGHFGVASPDARQQRPEYLGGGLSRINVHPIAQTSATEDGVTPQGNLAAMGTFRVEGHGFTASFTEHCTVLGLIAVRSDLTYQQGLNRMFSRRTRWDHYWPDLAHLGEQAILNEEIYCQGSSVDQEAFGYQERYAEYRYKPSIISGQFRSNYPQSLDKWHLAQEFETLPELDSTFIVENPPIDRVLAVENAPDFICDCLFDYKAVRPIPTYSIPGMMGRF